MNIEDAKATITSQAAEIARVTKERDGLFNSGIGTVAKLCAAEFSISVLATRAEAAERLLAEARAALTPSAETKAAYMGEFFERVEIANPMFEGNEDDEPETIIQSVPVSWTTIKEIMAAISARTLTNGGENGR